MIELHLRERMSDRSGGARSLHREACVRRDPCPSTSFLASTAVLSGHPMNDLPERRRLPRERLCRNQYSRLPTGKRPRLAPETTSCLVSWAYARNHYNHYPSSLQKRLTRSLLTALGG